jgi:hypothetical protein
MVGWSFEQPIVILNLFQDNAQPSLVILKQVQDNEDGTELVSRRGLEPRLTASKAAVLPLNEREPEMDR